MPSRLVGASITIPDLFKPLSAVDTVERARPVARAICNAESAPRSLRQRTIMLSGDAEGLSISQVLSEGFVMAQHKHR
ncbi:hypothetical protein X762_10840 [Mesorhizobium sp. LSHC426A00]|nr:hypothetical protein X762_10840 [Mesorhizobium sp. LSHC426A00]